MAAHEKWMPLYLGDYLADTLHLTTRQHGAYLLLLMHAWRSGGYIPENAAQQAAIVRMTVQDWSEECAPVLDFFEQSPDPDRRGLYHDRVGKELAIAVSVVKQRSSAGKASAAMRERNRQREVNETATEHQREPNEPVDPSLTSRCPSRDTPSPSPSVSKDTDAPDVASVVFGQGLAWMMAATGRTEANCRSQLGKWRKEIGDEALIAVLGRGQREAPIDTMAWLEKAVAAHGKGPARKPWDKTPPEFTGTVEPWEQRLRGYRPGGIWLEGQWGPRPESGRCRAPAAMLKAVGILAGEAA